VADREGGGSKILRGIVAAVVIVVAIILLAAFWRQTLHAVEGIWHWTTARIPTQNGQRIAVLVYLILSVLLAIMFSRAGHFTAYGLAITLGPLLWALFWEGFPVLGLHSSWTSSLGLNHLSPGKVVLFGVISALVITLVFVPLEMREKYLMRKHRLGEDE
jgi:hypothetical protein